MVAFLVLMNFWLIALWIFYLREPRLNIAWVNNFSISFRGVRFFNLHGFTS